MVSSYVLGVSAIYLAIVVVALVSAFFAYRIYRIAGPFGGRDILLTFSAFLMATASASVFEIFETLGMVFTWLEVTYLMATVASLTLFLVFSFDIKDGRI